MNNQNFITLSIPSFGPPWLSLRILHLSITFTFTSFQEYGYLVITKTRFEHLCGAQNFHILQSILHSGHTIYKVHYINLANHFYHLTVTYGQEYEINNIINS